MSKNTIAVTIVAFIVSGFMTFVIMGGNRLLPVRASGYIEQAHKAVRERLRDPESARFSDETVYETGVGNIYVCGNVNAKNDRGGYIGKFAFYFIQTTGDVLLGDDRHSGERVLQWCSEVKAKSAKAY